MGPLHAKIALWIFCANSLWMNAAPADLRGESHPVTSGAEALWTNTFMRTLLANGVLFWDNGSHEELQRN